MSGPQFFQTIMGRQFFDGTVPKIARALTKLADAAEVLAKAKIAEDRIKQIEIEVNALQRAQEHEPAEIAERIVKLSFEAESIRKGLG